MDKKLKKNILTVTNIIIIVLSIFLLIAGILANDFLKIILPILLIIGGLLNFITMSKSK
ncbi:MAG: hypothetical protein ACRCVG_03575 [Methanobacteriaceae archaeon]